MALANLLWAVPEDSSCIYCYCCSYSILVYLDTNCFGSPAGLIAELKSVAEDLEGELSIIVDFCWRDDARLGIPSLACGAPAMLF